MKCNQAKFRSRPMLGNPDLTWRPIHFAPTQNMNVQMLHGLSAVFADVGDESKTMRAFFFADASRDLHDVAQSTPICSRGVFKRLARNDQNVNRRDRRDIRETRRKFRLRKLSRLRFRRARFFRKWCRALILLPNATRFDRLCARFSIELKLPRLGWTFQFNFHHPTPIPQK